MSTSPSPANHATGKCVVCGKETVTRCSACAKNGTDWMFFCSTEHQKLIWKVHKFVCGPRSKPFCWPGLSQREIDDLIALTEVPMLQPLIEVLVSLYGGVEDFKIHVAALKDPPLGQRLTTLQSLNMLALRPMLFNMQESIEKVLKVPEVTRLSNLMINYPFNSLGHIFQTSPTPDISKEAYGSWSSDLQHKVLINMVVGTVAVARLSQSTYALTENTTQELKHFARTVIASTHPKEAAEWLDWMERASARPGMS